VDFLPGKSESDVHTTAALSFSGEHGITEHFSQNQQGGSPI